MELAGKVDALQKEKGEIQKSHKKLENKLKKLEPKKADQKDKKSTRVQSSQPELTSATGQAKAELLYQKERDRNEVLSYIDKTGLQCYHCYSCRHFS